MAIYIGVIEDGGTNRLYISSVSADDDRFDAESVLADCSRLGRKDIRVANTDLNILRNKLTNGGIPNALIVME
jgi:hypothetical protein